MLWIVAAAIAAGTPASSHQTPAVVAQASVSVRIVSGVQLKLDSTMNEGAPPAHDSKITADGTQHDARLIEFE